jgi:Flp pilus assembly protein TadG
MRLHDKPRSGATLVEFAVVAPITFLLVLGLIIGGLGVFRYQEMAHLSREASRWASVHGAQYAKETGNPAATPNDVYQQVIAREAAALDLSKLNYSVIWNTDNRPYHTTIVNNQVVPVYNTVTVTITYQWVPEAFLGGITLTSTSVATMSY